MSPIRVASHEPVGATVTGLSVDPVDPTTVAELTRLLAEHGVLILPDQPVDDAGFLGFLRRFGQLVFATGETPVDGFADLNVVSNVGRTTPPRSVFHTDTSYLSRPPSYTALRAVAIPLHGGGTVFTNQYHAFDTLPAPLRRKLEGRTITHVVTGLDLTDNDETSAQHPIFRRHPISGRTAVFVSTPQRCIAVSGLTAEESVEVVRELYEHCTQPDNTYHHSWSAGDVVMWDNRCVLHRGDHSEVLGDRILHRGMVVQDDAEMAAGCA